MFFKQLTGHYTIQVNTSYLRIQKIYIFDILVHIINLAYLHKLSPVPVQEKGLLSDKGIYTRFHSTGWDQCQKHYKSILRAEHHLSR